MKTSFTALSKKLNLVSKIFQPLNVILKNSILKQKTEPISKSQRLMLDLGIIRSSSTGTFCILPLGERSLRKLINIVDDELEQIGAQKLILPLLTHGELWKVSGRWDSAKSELFTLQDRQDREYILSPTNEEAITELLASISSTLSYKQLPLRLYQISNKFRNEIKPRFGLIRSREFLMKDLYTFDASDSNAESTYEEVNQCYQNIFNKIGIPIIRVQASSDLMGGSLSHEFHFPTSIGEDILYICKSCKNAINKDMIDSNIIECIKCGNKDFSITPGIEVGHTFILGTKYSEPLKAYFKTENNKNSPLQMGCYGLGMTRIIAAACETLSKEKELRWPSILAPFQICLIPPKSGSREYSLGYNLMEQLYSVLNSTNFNDDVIIDDRYSWTIGKRLVEARRLGYPYIIVAGRGVSKSPPVLELYQLYENQENNCTEETFESLVDKLNNFTKTNEEPKKNIFAM